MTHPHPRPDHSGSASIPPDLVHRLAAGIAARVDSHGIEERRAVVGHALAAPAAVSGAGVPAPPDWRGQSHAGLRRVVARSLVLKLIVAVAALVAATGALAATGVLPDPVQHQVTRVARSVGIPVRGHRVRHASRRPAVARSRPAPSPTFETGRRPAASNERSRVEPSAASAQRHRPDDESHDDDAGEIRHAGSSDQGRAEASHGTVSHEHLQSGSGGEADGATSRPSSPVSNGSDGESGSGSGSGASDDDAGSSGTGGGIQQPESTSGDDGHDG